MNRWGFMSFLGELPFLYTINKFFPTELAPKSEPKEYFDP
jgi:hypothetical protein